MRRENRREPSPTKAFRREAMAEGYFKAFFVEEARLGMGASGSVYLHSLRCLGLLHVDLRLGVCDAGSAFRLCHG